MKRALIGIGLGLGLALGLGSANADTIKVPAGFTIDNAQSEALTAKLNQLGQFGLPLSTQAIANVDVYTAPAPGVVLTVTLVAAQITEDRDAAARAAVDELHATSQRAALAGSGISEDGWQEKVDPAAKQIEATLAWHDAAAKTSSTSRILIVGDADQLISATAECLAADDAPAKLVADCKAALASLDPGLGADKRVALALAPTGARPKQPEPAGSGSGYQPATMTDGTRAPLPPMTIPEERRTVDRRPVYVGLGLVVAAAVFWWNRRRRARREDD